MKKSRERVFRTCSRKRQKESRKKEKKTWPTWRDFGRDSFFPPCHPFKWLNVVILTRRYIGVAGQEEEEGGEISTSNNKYQQPVGKQQ